MVHVLRPSQVRDISSLMLDESGRLRVLPAHLLAQTTSEERGLFGVRYAYYGFLTLELVHFLKTLIRGRTAIEVGAGHGGLARALGIPATDSHQQSRPEIAAYYSALQQPTIKYGSNVEKLTALEAIEKYQPQVVIGSWVTHKYNPSRAWAGGNEDGLDERLILSKCETYVVVGNEKVHEHKEIWDEPHVKDTPPWVFSRAINGSADFVAVWDRPALKQAESFVR